MPVRRQFLFGLASLALSAPAIVRLYPLMSVRPIASLGPPTTSLGFAQRLYVDACIRRMAPFRNAGHSDLEIATSLNAGGLKMMNGEA